MSTTATATASLKTNATTTVALALRVRAENPNHHLWNNHGTWFLHYTIHPTSFTKERVRRSLGTKDLATARERRDTFFRYLIHRTDRPRTVCHPIGDNPSETAGLEDPRKTVAA